MGLQDRDYMSDAKTSKKNHFDKRKWESAFKQAESKTKEKRKEELKPRITKNVVKKTTEISKEKKAKRLDLEQKIRNIEFWQWLLIWGGIVAILGVLEKHMRVI